MGINLSQQVFIVGFKDEYVWSEYLQYLLKIILAMIKDILHSNFFSSFGIFLI